MNSTNEQELRELIEDHLTNMLTDPKPVDVDYGMHLVDAHTNAEIAKVLDRLTVADNISDRACSEAIQAERAKLKEVK